MLFGCASPITSIAQLHGKITCQPLPPQHAGSRASAAAASAAVVALSLALGLMGAWLLTSRPLRWDSIIASLVRSEGGLENFACLIPGWSTCCSRRHV